MSLSCLYYLINSTSTACLENFCRRRLGKLDLTLSISLFVFLAWSSIWFRKGERVWLAVGLPNLLSNSFNACTPAGPLNSSTTSSSVSSYNRKQENLQTDSHTYNIYLYTITDSQSLLYFPGKNWYLKHWISWILRLCWSLPTVLTVFSIYKWF